MSLIPAATLDEALATASGLLPEEYSAYIIPQAGTVLPIFKPGER